MAVRIRLRRMGRKGQPHYRIVVADARAARDGKFIENIGYYQPLSDPSGIKLDEERALFWLKNGAQPSDQVKNILLKTGLWGKFEQERSRRGEQGAGAKKYA